MFEKRKVEYANELKNSIIYIFNKIRGIIQGNKQDCFNCRVTQTKPWYRYLKEHYLCQPCQKNVSTTILFVNQDGSKRLPS
uniref:GATA-type domain-containing protein n=1 Tax=Meloidogyne enterolobii TaxID=390850 RepID=A0A6V7WJT3_MELEN|nr:unnamed protein product [Meloidogyne enterolobii]